MESTATDEAVYLRQTLFRPDQPPLTAVFAKDGLKEEIHASANATRTLFGDAVDVEIFSWSGGLISASAEAHRRAMEGRTPRTKRYRDTLHDYLIATLPLCAPAGVIAPKSPAPLSTEDVKEVLRAVDAHGTVGARTIVVVSMEGDAVKLSRGSIQVWRP